MRKLVIATLASAAALAFSGCETSDDRTLAAGQACLDSATQATAASCATMVQGLTSQEAYMIQCSADFIQQGFTGSRVVDAIKNINSNSSTTDATTGLIAYMIFKNTSPSADHAISVCTSAGSKSMLRLATAAKLATTIASAAGALTTIDPNSPSAAAQMQAAVQTMLTANNSTNNAAVGSIAVTANTAYCSDGSSYKSTQVCTDLSAALASSSDPAQVGSYLLNLMKSPH